MIIFTDIGNSHTWVGRAEWSRFYAHLCEVEHEDGGRHGTISILGTARLVLMSLSGLPARRFANHHAALLGGIDCVGLILVVSGAIRRAGDADGQRLGPGDVHVVDLSSPRDWRSADSQRLGEIALFVPRQRFTQAFSVASVDGWKALSGTPAADVIGAALRALADHAEQVDRAQLEAFGQAIVDMAIAAMAASFKRAAGSARPVSAPFANVRRFIEANLMSDALTPDLIAGNFGMSRAVLYRLFEPVGGVATYIRRQRMARALRELTSQGASNVHIGVIAKRYGYTSPAAFTRAFTETYGISPRLLASGAVSVKQGGLRLIDWLAPLCGRAPPPASSPPV